MYVGKKRMNIPYFIVLYITVLFTSSCNHFQDKESLVNNFLIKQVDSASKHLLAFNEFKKVDGIEKQKESLIYEMSFKGFVGAVDDCYWDGSIVSSSATARLAQSLYGSNWGIGKLTLLDMKVAKSIHELSQKDDIDRNYSLYKKDYGHYVKGVAVLEKHDSGWKIISMDISYDEDASNAVNQKSEKGSESTLKSDSNFVRKTKEDIQYGGDFSYNLKDQSNGHAFIYPENDSTILFYLDISRGAPSYNMGSLYGRVKILNGKGVYYPKKNDYERGCKLSFNFNKNTLLIKTIEPSNDCGFGNGVEADGTYYKSSSKIPSYFEDMEGTKVYFKNTKPEEYNN